MLKNNETSNVWEFQKHDLNFMSKQLLMDTPAVVYTTWFIYIIFVLILGPKMMKNRPAYNLSGTLVVYNAIQVALCLYSLYLGVPILWKHGLKPICHDNHNDSIGYLKAIYVYFLLKPTELLDTVFFVLRKKYNQASFLHVYHHSYMVLATWLILRYDPSYANLFPGMLNSFVHVIMYTYYALSAYPSLAKYLWWKKYITSLQLIQFVMIIGQQLQSYHTSECPPTFLHAYSWIANCTLFIILFSNFYFKSYTKSNKSISSLNGSENGREVDSKINGWQNGNSDSKGNETDSKEISANEFAKDSKKII